MPSSSVVPGKLWGALVDLLVTFLSHEHPIVPSRSRGPQMSSKSSETAQNFHYRLLLGCLEAVTLVMAHVLVIPRPEVRRGGRLGSRRTQKCLKSALADDPRSALLAPDI